MFCAAQTATCSTPDLLIANSSLTLHPVAVCSPALGKSRAYGIPGFALFVPVAISFLVALTLVSLNAGCLGPSDDSSNDTARDATRPLFNGKDLDGWVIESGGQFSVRDGLLVVNRGTGWLRSVQEFGDFILEMEFRFLEEQANSGIFVRTGPTSKDDENGWPDNGYQVQCMDTITGQYPLATMIPYGAPDFVHESDLEALARAYRPTREWNHYEITCDGEDLKVKLNGELITSARDIKNLRGHIGIQAEHGLLEFRNIGVRILD